MSIETLSFSEAVISKKEISQQASNYSYYQQLKIKSEKKNEEKKNEEEEIQETFAKMKVSNHLIDRLLEDYAKDEAINTGNSNDVGVDTKPKKKAIFCTKCKGAQYYEQADLRKHFKTEWHNFNAKLSAQV